MWCKIDNVSPRVFRHSVSCWDAEWLHVTDFNVPKPTGKLSVRLCYFSLYRLFAREKYWQFHRIIRPNKFPPDWKCATLQCLTQLCRSVITDGGHTVRGQLVWEGVNLEDPRCEGGYLQGRVRGRVRDVVSGVCGGATPADSRLVTSTAPAGWCQLESSHIMNMHKGTGACRKTNIGVWAVWIVSIEFWVSEFHTHHWTCLFFFLFLSSQNERKSILQLEVCWLLTTFRRATILVHTMSVLFYLISIHSFKNKICLYILPQFPVLRVFLSDWIEHNQIFPLVELCLSQIHCRAIVKLAGLSKWENLSAYYERRLE